MTRRFLAFSCAAVSRSAGIFGQAPAMKASEEWTPPKTPWGDPDLQGMWPGNMGVPMQRPEALGTRATLTDAEFAQKEAQAKKQAQADSESTVASDSAAGNRSTVLLDRAWNTHAANLADRGSAERKTAAR